MGQDAGFALAYAGPVAARPRGLSLSCDLGTARVMSGVCLPRN